jgi:dTDP-4-amino-4,6-dideoxygalactose transaminase
VGDDQQIPFSKVTVTSSESTYVLEALRSGKLSGDGDFTRRCHDLLEMRLPGAKALLTHSGTGALEMAAMLCRLKPGDEVIMPSYTFSSTANCVALRGAVPVFADIDPATLNLDPSSVRRAITPRSRAIFVVHYAGVPCDMDAINAIAATNGLVVVEDAAQALGSLYKGRPAGTLGSMAAFSFHETKNVISGEGGAFVVTDPAYYEAAEIIREKGTNRSRFFRGEVDKYTWVDLGSSYLPSEIVAAMLLAQLERIDAISADRMATWEFYHQSFAGLEAAGFVRRPVVPDCVVHNGHLYYLLLNKTQDRGRFIEAMRSAGVSTPFHYVPLHSSPAGRELGRVGAGLPVTEDIAERLVRLPLFFGMAGTANRVAEKVNNFLVA